MGNGTGRRGVGEGELSLFSDVVQGLNKPWVGPSLTAALLPPGSSLPRTPSTCTTPHCARLSSKQSNWNDPRSNVFITLKKTTTPVFLFVLIYLSIVIEKVLY